MSIRITKRGKKISQECLAVVESEMRLRLPDDYRQFLLKYNGGTPEINILDIPGTSNSLGVSEFFEADQIKSEKENLGSRLPRDMWPIADAECGDLVCIRLSNEDWGIYYWDHELEPEQGDDCMKNMFLVARTFTEFWESLKKFDPKSIELRPGQVKSVWVSPELRKFQKKKPAL